MAWTSSQSTQRDLGLVQMLLPSNLDHLQNWHCCGSLAKRSLALDLDSQPGQWQVQQLASHLHGSCDLTL